MSFLVGHMTMSLDGYIATDTDGVGARLEWHDVGRSQCRAPIQASSFMSTAGAMSTRSTLRSWSSRIGSGQAFFGTLTRGPIMLDDPAITPGTRATHLRYRVRR